MLDIRNGRALTVRKLTEQEAAALDGMYRTVLLCNSVEPWASGMEQDEQPFYFVNRALFVALEDLYGQDHAKQLLEEIHSCGENPSRVIPQYFDEIMHSE